MIVDRLIINSTGNEDHQPLTFTFETTKAKFVLSKIFPRTEGRPYLHSHPVSELLKLSGLVELESPLVADVGLCGDSRIKEGAVADVFHRLLLQLLSELLPLLGSDVSLPIHFHCKWLNISSSQYYNNLKLLRSHIKTLRVFQNSSSHLNFWTQGKQTKDSIYMTKEGSFGWKMSLLIPKIGAWGIS